MADTLRVLYVDDEPDLLGIGKIFLEESGDFSVTTIGSAPAALALLKKEQFDAIISDYQMPGMDGIQFLVEVRTHFGAVPFILFTGKGREEVVIQAINSGADFYLQKGGNPQAQFAELVHKIKQAASRKRADDSLRNSEEQHRTILQTTLDGIWMVDADGKITDVNEIYCRMSGYTRAELLKLRVTDLDAIEKPAETAAHLKSIIENGSGFFESSHRRKDGSTFDVEVSTMYLNADGGKFICFCRDVTERKHADDALRESEERYRTIYDQSPITIELYDATGVLVHINPAGLKLFGIESIQEIQNFSLFADPNVNDEQKVRLHKGETVQYSGPFDFEKVKTLNLYTTSREGIIWLDVLITPLGNHEDSITGFLVQIQDITKRKRAEEAHRQSEERFRLITETIDEAFWMADVEIGKIFYVSPSFERIWGLSRESLYKNPRSFLDAVHKEDRERVLADLEIEKTGQPFDHEYRIVLPDGNIRNIWDRGFPIRDEKGQISIYVGVATDITDSKVAEVALRYQNEMRETILDSIPVMVMFFDREGHCQWINRCWQSTLGWSFEEMRQHKDIFSEFYPDPEYRKYVMDYITSASGAGRWSDFKTRIRDGQVLDTSWINVPLSDGSIIGLGIDITERKQAGDALQLKDFAIESSINAIAIADLSGNLTDVNPAFLSIWRYEHRQEVLGRSVLSFWKVPDEAQQVVDGIKAQGTWSGEMTGQRKDSTPIPVQLSANLIRDVAGTPVAMMGSFIDITEHKRVEEALAESESFNRGIVENLPDYIVVYGSDGKILYVNPASARLLGYDADKLVGTPLLSYIAEECRDEVVSRIAERRKGGEVSPYEINLILSDGRQRTVIVKGSPIQYHDNPAVLLLLIDITESKRAAEALAKANQKLNVLSGLTRKDLTNQVFVLNSYLEMLKKGAAGQESILENIQKCERAARSISEITEFTKNFQDMGAKPPKWQNVKTALLLGLSHISIGEIQHSIETEDLEIFADPLLEDVCQHLFENSFLHGEHVTRVRVWHAATPREVTIFFEDNGTGIPLEKKEQVFVRGGTANRASMRSLIFVREILDITGITITETGEPGKGARFEITVPEGAWRMTGESE
jgi:PAS domain S-box-containing protein